MSYLHTRFETAEFRPKALKMFGRGVRRAIASSLRLPRLQPVGQENIGDDEEPSQQTMFPFAIRNKGRPLSPDDCKTLYRALARNASDAVLPTERMCDADENMAHVNVQRKVNRVGAIVAKIEWLLKHMDGLKLREIRHGS